MRIRRNHLPGMMLALLSVVLWVSGCNVHYSRGLSLEAQNRWEEAAIEFHLAIVEDPEEEEYHEALARANRVVAGENIVLYRTYLARKEFKKAYNRLSDALRQNPELQEARAEMEKWMRVLVAGQVEMEFDQLHANLNLADEIQLMLHINTPNPGEIIEAEIDLETGTFFVENLLYDRPKELYAYYSLNAIGVSMTYGRGKLRKFTSREFLRFVNFRTPVLDNLSGNISTKGGGNMVAVEQHRKQITDQTQDTTHWSPRRVPHYSLKVDGSTIRVAATEGSGLYTPRFLYINGQEQRMFVDFGRYEVKSQQEDQWGIRRLNLREKDYFPTVARNIALQPYFFYREDVFIYLPEGKG